MQILQNASISQVYAGTINFCWINRMWLTFARLESFSNEWKRDYSLDKESKCYLNERAHQDRLVDIIPPSSSWRRAWIFGLNEYALFVMSESSRSSSDVKELMTRDYWIASRGSHSLICIPHFSIHEVATLDDRVEPKENHCSSAYSCRSNTPYIKQNDQCSKNF